MLEILICIAAVLYAVDTFVEIAAGRKLEEQNELLREEIRILRNREEDGLHG